MACVSMKTEPTTGISGRTRGEKLSAFGLFSKLSYYCPLQIKLDVIVSKMLVYTILNVAISMALRRRTRVECI